MVAKPVKTIELHPLFPLFLTVSNLNSIQPTMTKLCEFSYSTAVCQGKFSGHESIVCSVHENRFFYDKVLALYKLKLKGCF